MAKKDKESVIALETDKYEDKVKEFQDYLQQNPIVTRVTKDGTITEADGEQEKRHKEMLIQMKVLDALPNWLLAVKKLREENEERVDLRGDSEISDSARLMMNRNKQ